MQRESVKQRKIRPALDRVAGRAHRRACHLTCRMAVWQPEILPEQPAAHRLCDAPVFRAL